MCDTSKPYHGADSCFPLNHLAETPWSLSEVFGQPIKGACPLTIPVGDGAETVCINVPRMREVNVEAAPPYSLRKSKDGLTRCYKPGSKLTFDIWLACLLGIDLNQKIPTSILYFLGRPVVKSFNIHNLPCMQLVQSLDMVKSVEVYRPFCKTHQLYQQLSSYISNRSLGLYALICIPSEPHSHTPMALEALIPLPKCTIKQPLTDIAAPIWNCSYPSLLQAH